MQPCHYSLIQFRPDPAREEGLNVGLVVVRAPGEVSVRTLHSEGLEGVIRRMGGDPAELERLARALRAFATRLGQLGDATAAGLNGFASCEAGTLELLPAHAVASGDPDRIAEILFPRLVGTEGDTGGLGIRRA